MWKLIFDTAKRVLLLTEQTARNRKDIEDMQRQMKVMSAAIERLAYEIRRVSDKDESEREKMRLQLENMLLRFERRLPPERE